MSTAAELIERLQNDINALDVILLGNEYQDVTLNGVTKPTISKALRLRMESYRTISTSAPNTIPRDGEEWIVTE